MSDDLQNQKPPPLPPDDGEQPTTSRRAFLARTGGTTAGLLGLSLAACDRDEQPEPRAGAPAAEEASAVPEGKDPDDFILHSSTPLTLETKRAAFGASLLVPYDLLFVRANLPFPDASVLEDRDGWQVAVEGVGTPRAVTVGELKGFGLETVVTVLQCSGNGRTFFEHGASGSQWGVGAAGCVTWAGVPVRAVADALGGVASDARFVTATGGEELPEGVDPKEVVVERSIPLEKGMDDAILAWEMNGEPLPLVHGGPLRLIVPGFYGVNQVKFVKRIAFTPEESDAKIMTSGYRIRPVGVAGDPSQPTMWEMEVKSWINHPSGDGSVPAGRVVVDGVAFAGGQPIRRVEVSVDGGETWQPAPLIGPEMGPYAWRQFALPVTLARGTRTLVSRATDAAGNSQPAERLENERGYGNTSWRDHAVTVTVV